MNKTEELESLTLIYDPDFVAVTETWLTEDVADTDVFPISFHVLRNDRLTRGGGVALLIKKTLRYELLPPIKDCENVWCKLFMGDITLLIGVLYRPPGTSVDIFEKLDDYLLTMTNKRSRVIITGDFNLPGVDWNARVAGPLNRPLAENLLDIMIKYDLVQVVDKPTRVQGQTETLLDLLFLSQEVFDYEISIEDGISDHKVVAATLKPNKKLEKITRVKVYNFQAADDTSILDYLEMAFDAIPPTDDVNDLWEYFKKVVNDCLSRFVPQREKRTAKANPWITRSIIHLKRRLCRARQKIPRNSSVIAHISAQVRREVKQSKSNFLTNILSEYISNSPQKFWRYLSSSQSEITGLSIDGTSYSEPIQIAEALNHYFSTVFSPSIDHSKKGCTFDDTSSNLLTVSKEGVMALLLELDHKKSPGPDMIPNEFLRRYSDWVSSFLVKIFNLSLCTAAVPIDWLLARVAPIFKAGDRLNVCNYRPISITCTACKVIEHIISKYIFQYIENNNLFYNKQHGFRKGLSTVTQLFESVHAFATAINSKEQVDVIAIDFSKAFDRVCHQKLIQKMLILGIDPAIVRWVEAYLRNRLQFVEISGARSSLLRVSSGVPQGSVLGPLLFLIYVNDIATVVPPFVDVRLYADDCLLFCHVKSVSDQMLLNDALRCIDNWCEKWDMKINFDKTVCMTISNKKTPLNYKYTINNREIKSSNELKYLGVTISSSLKWDKHIDNITGLAKRKLGFLRRKLRNAPPSVKLLAYKTIVRPTLEYAAIIWDPHTKTEINKLERVQRLAARFIYSNYMRTQSVSLLLARADLQSLATRRKIARLKFIYDLYHKNYKLDPSVYLRPPGRVSARTNHSFSVQAYVPRVDVFKFSFLVRSIVDWNALPPEVLTGCRSSQDFQRRLDLFFA